MEKLNQKKRPLSGAVVTALMGALILSGCATTRTDDYQAKPANQYKGCVARNKLALAVDPMTNPRDQIRYFGANLNKDHILPILVIADNRSDTSTFLIDQDHFVIDTLKKQGNMKEDGLNKAAAGTAAVGSLFAPLALTALAPAALIGGTKMVSDASIIKHNLLVKALKRNTLSPGESANGFIYFKLPKDQDLDNLTFTVRFKMETLGSDAVDYINVEIKR